jgi:DNA-directed RNA polymerase specialized sigma24 family protein
LNGCFPSSAAHCRRSSVGVPSCRLDATDLAQEVYLRMLRIADTDAILNLEAYLFGVASNVAKEHAVLSARHGTNRRH